MEDVVRQVGSFEAAEAADIEEDLAMTPEQPDADQQGFARVYRITQRQKS